MAVSAADFDPDGPGLDGLYGVEVPLEDAGLVVVPVPFQATASYGRGTRDGPAAVRAASLQIDLDDVQFGPSYALGIGWDGSRGDEIAALGDGVDAEARAVIEAGGADTDEASAALRASRDAVDAASAAVRALVQEGAEAALARGAVPVVLGGDHSSPLGNIAAVAARHPGLGIFHVDAHADLRVAYLGFTESHASIMHNALALPGVAGLVGVGYRDMGRAERKRIAEDGRIMAVLDDELGRRRLAQEPFSAVVDAVCAALPDTVYLSIDIDGLEPSLCPDTGTPVPGGLDWHQLCALLEGIARTKRIVGADLCEVAPGQSGAEGRDGWDAIVGARVLYKLIGAVALSRGRERVDRTQRAR
jgi:agmatinase